MGFFEKIKDGLRKTRESMMKQVDGFLNSFTKIDEELFEELEEILITCDIGVATSVRICDDLRKRVKEKGIKDPSEIKNEMKDIILTILGEDTPLDLSTKPSVVVVIGVNGAGKTTTIGKYVSRLKSEGKKVVVAAADTFRAAAIDQLEVWTTRSGVDLVKHAEGSDPSAVVFDAITAAKSRGAEHRRVFENTRWWRCKCRRDNHLPRRADCSSRRTGKAAACPASRTRTHCAARLLSAEKNVAADNNCSSGTLYFPPVAERQQRA